MDKCILNNAVLVLDSRSVLGSEFTNALYHSFFRKGSLLSAALHCNSSEPHETLTLLNPIQFPLRVGGNDLNITKVKSLTFLFSKAAGI